MQSQIPQAGRDAIVGNETAVQLQISGGRMVQIVRVGSDWSVPDFPQVKPHRNLKVIMDRLRAIGAISKA